MANTVYRKVALKQHTEWEAAEVITPGSLIEITSAGKVQNHSTDAGAAAKLFAAEDAMQGHDLDDNYAAGDKVMVWQPYPGDIVLARCGGDSAENIQIGDPVKSAGDGTLEKYSPSSGDSGDAVGSGAFIGIALEAAGFGDRFDVLIV